jgi:thiol-disulfide isomerase/thioredoxin
MSLSKFALNSVVLILPFSSIKFAARIDVVTVESSALKTVTQRPSPPNNFTTEVSLSSFALRGVAASTVLTTALMVNCSSWTKQAPEGMKAANERKAARDFTLSDTKSARVKLSDYKGKVVLLNFWATWCGPCKVEVPWFIEFEKKYQDRGFAVLGVSMDEGGLEVVRTFMEEHKVNYRVAIWHRPSGAAVRRSRFLADDIHY